MIFPRTFWLWRHICGVKYTLFSYPQEWSTLSIRVAHNCAIEDCCFLYILFQDFLEIPERLLQNFTINLRWNVSRVLVSFCGAIIITCSQRLISLITRSIMLSYYFSLLFSEAFSLLALYSLRLFFIWPSLQRLYTATVMYGRRFVFTAVLSGVKNLVKLNYIAFFTTPLPLQVTQYGVNTHTHTHMYIYINHYQCNRLDHII